MNQTFRFLRGWGSLMKFVAQARGRFFSEKIRLRERRERWQVAWDKAQSLPPGSVRDETLAQLEAEGEAIKREEEKLAKEEEAFTYMSDHPSLVAETRLVAQASVKSEKAQDGPDQGPHLEPVTLIPSHQDTGPTLRNRRTHSEAPDNS